jgi:transcriptional regulator with GAF, ATPase, and Fis domain
MTADAAFDILRARAGVMYDPNVVDTFIRIQPAIAPVDTQPAPQPHVLDRISQTRRAAGRSDESASGSSAVSDDVLAFVSLSRMASGESSVSDVLALASNLLRTVTANATAVWYLIDPVRSELVVAHASGAAAASFRGLTMAIGSRVTGWVAANRQAIVNADPVLDCGGPSEPALHSCLSVPLTTGDSVVGVLTLYAPHSKAFTEDQGRMLQMIAPHVAQALARARKSGVEQPEKSHGLRLVAAR